MIRATFENSGLSAVSDTTIKAVQNSVVASISVRCELLALNNKEQLLR